MKRIPLLLAVLCVTACDGGVRDTLGLTRKAPDEFRVISRPPLTVPPEFNLRPPGRPGEMPETAEPPARRQAESLILGEDQSVTLLPGASDTAVSPVAAGALDSPADALFLERAGASKADPSVREALKTEEYTDYEEEKSWLQKLRESSKDEPVVKAKDEAERIKENTAAGKPVTEGETPTAKPRDTGTLGRILGY